MYTPYFSTDKYCSHTCAYKRHREIELTKTILTMFEIGDNYNESHKKISAKSKKNSTTLKELAKRSQAAVNRYIRARDYNKACVSCGVNNNDVVGPWNAGHWRSRGSALHLRFNLLNIHKQCVEDNLHKSGLEIPYRIELITRIGLESVQKLENDNKPRKFTREYLIRIKQLFNKRAKFYEKRNENGYQVQE